jgi:hypothetical protein
MGKEVVIVKRDKKARAIRTFVSVKSLGAEMELQDFVAALADGYGSPFATLTRRGLLEGLQNAANQVIRDMKLQTTEVAAVSVPE